eukprot:1186029-Prorocentrum_minimum.AAC.1
MAVEPLVDISLPAPASYVSESYGCLNVTAAAVRSLCCAHQAGRFGRGGVEFARGGAGFVRRADEGPRGRLAGGGGARDPAEGGAVRGGRGPGPRGGPLQTPRLAQRQGEEEVRAPQTPRLPSTPYRPCAG